MQISQAQPKIDQPLPERLLKASEVAEILNISKAFVYQLMQQKKIRTVKIGHVRRVRQADLQSFIKENLSQHVSSFR